MSLSTTGFVPPLTISSGLKGRRTRLNLEQQPLAGFALSERGHRTKLIYPSLAKRLSAAKQRCENPKSPGFKTYGAKGIAFQFPSVASAYVWILENIGPPPHEMELDRIDNSSGYRPGNLRWSSKMQNRRHTAKTTNAPALHKFRLQHPEVRYADNTLKNLLSMGLTFNQIVERWSRPSCKPKGVYGTYSIAAPEIALLAKDC
jgi:hypothetical protein